MKKLLSISLLFILISPLLFNYLNIKLQIKSYKRAFKQKIISKIDDKELVKLKFHQNEIKKLGWKHIKEFEYNKNMYDVIKFDKNNDTITYWCWIDNEETKLNNQLKNLLTEFLIQNPIENSSRNKILCFFQSLYFVKSSHLNNFKIKLENKNRISSFNINYDFNVINNIFNPPRISKMLN